MSCLFYDTKYRILVHVHYIICDDVIESDFFRSNPEFESSSIRGVCRTCSTCLCDFQIFFFHFEFICPRRAHLKILISADPGGFPNERSSFLSSYSVYKEKFNSFGFHLWIKKSFETQVDVTKKYKVLPSFECLCQDTCPSYLSLIEEKESRCQLFEIEHQ